jgi:hypothetical protein
MNASPNPGPPARIPAGHQTGQRARANYGQTFVTLFVIHYIFLF